MQLHLQRLLFSFLVFSCELGHTAESLQVNPRETVRTEIVGLNGFRWHYSFDIEMTKQALAVTVAVNLVPASGVTMVELARVKPVWKKGIEHIWSNRYAIKTASGQIYPILFNVRFHGPRYHHSVIVRPGKGFSDELNWNLQDSEQTVAHEFGHMIGAYDEYRRGANDPVNPVIDENSIMTSNPKTGRCFARHFDKIKNWLQEKGWDEHLKVVTFE